MLCCCSPGWSTSAADHVYQCSCFWVPNLCLHFGLAAGTTTFICTCSNCGCVLFPHPRKGQRRHHDPVRLVIPMRLRDTCHLASRLKTPIVSRETTLQCTTAQLPESTTTLNSISTSAKRANKHAVCSCSTAVCSTCVTYTCSSRADTCTSPFL